MCSAYLNVGSNICCYDSMDVLPGGPYMVASVIHHAGCTIPINKFAGYKDFLLHGNSVALDSTRGSFILLRNMSNTIMNVNAVDCNIIANMLQQRKKNHEARKEKEEALAREAQEEEDEELCKEEEEEDEELCTEEEEAQEEKDEELCTEQEELRKEQEEELREQEELVRRIIKYQPVLSQVARCCFVAGLSYFIGSYGFELF